MFGPSQLFVWLIVLGSLRARDVEISAGRSPHTYDDDVEETSAGCSDEFRRTAVGPHRHAFGNRHVPVYRHRGFDPSVGRRLGRHALGARGPCEGLRAAITGCGGSLFKHTGDGACAVFSSPKGAVEAAVAAQQALELPVRMGVATDLIDLGARRLRDIAKPVQVFQVRAPGPRKEFPPRRTLDATPGNLRLLTTSLVGREAELAELATALKAHRLLTLTGIGGSARRDSQSEWRRARRGFSARARRRFSRLRRAGS
jgi:hypothetical protein